MQGHGARAAASCVGRPRDRGCGERGLDVAPLDGRVEAITGPLTSSRGCPCDAADPSVAPHSFVDVDARPPEERGIVRGVKPSDGGEARPNAPRCRLEPLG